MTPTHLDITLVCLRFFTNATRRTRALTSLILAAALGCMTALGSAPKLTVRSSLASGDAPKPTPSVKVEPCVDPDQNCLADLPLGDGPEFVRYFRTFSLSERNADIDQAVIVIHGNGRNAGSYFRAVVGGVAQAGLLHTTLVIAPHYKASVGSCQDAVDEYELYWTCNGWKDGQAARNSPAGASIYSFDAVDRLHVLLTDRSIFPNLKRLRVTGHSAGGQYMQRYAAGNHTEQKLPLPVKYIIANPSSYMYLDDQRIMQDATCYEDGTCTGDFTTYWDRENCPQYNDYKYGMDNRTGYMALVKDDTILEQYKTRSISYLLGELDTEQDPDLDTSCPAMAQGRHRRERGTIFWNYMRMQYHTDQDFIIVPGCGHSASCMYQSEEGIKAVLF